MTPWRGLSLCFCYEKYQQVAVFLEIHFKNIAYFNKNKQSFICLELGENKFGEEDVIGIEK